MPTIGELTGYAPSAPKRYYLLAEPQEPQRRERPRVERYWNPGAVKARKIKRYRRRPRKTAAAVIGFLAAKEARDRAAFLTASPRILRNLGRF